MDQKKDQRNSNDEIDLIQLFIKIWGYKKFIILFTSIVVLIGVLYALLAKPYYQSTITLYQTKNEKGSTSGISALASQFGFGGMGTKSDYNLGDLINSRKISEKIIYNKWVTEKCDTLINLVNFWEIKAETEGKIKKNACDRIKGTITYSENNETGLISISVLMEEPQLAADIANYLAEVLNEYIKNDQKTSTKENIKYIEERLATVKAELRQAEEELKDFREKNRDITMSPELQLESGRFMRKVTIKQEVYLTLEQQNELALIELVKETPVINVLDEAIKPELRTKPKRKLIVIISGFIGGFLSIFIVIILEIIKVIKANYLDKYKKI
ncbi:Wzz/FepE/Etk N-terminal domain-containing protein [Bacteroidota bacterium]